MGRFDKYPRLEREPPQYRLTIDDIKTLSLDTDPSLWSIILGLREETLNELFTKAKRNRYTEKQHIRFLKTLSDSLQCKSTPACTSNILNVMKKGRLFNHTMKMVQSCLNKGNTSFALDVMFELIRLLKRASRLKQNEKLFITESFNVLSRFMSTFESSVEQKLLSRFHIEIKKYTLNEQELSNKERSFRSAEIFPSIVDVNNESRAPLKPNQIKGAYSSTDEYLEVQFWLLHEDFNASLRESIKCLREVKYIEYTNEYVYEKAEIHSPVCGDAGTNYTLYLQGRNADRLKFGSLVCLSGDHFQTFYVAEVIKHNEPEYVVVQFLNNNDDKIQTLIWSKLLMIEPSAYFVAYRPVLQSLQITHEIDLPFQRYLVQCEKDIFPPKYLKRRKYFFDLSCLSGISSSSTIKDHLKSVDILEEVWPFENEFKLDSSQLQALKYALSNEISIIQGPPGCGKTFIGLEIAKVLLCNKTAWRRDGREHSQMLVVCSANHALDQFLEAICPFHSGSMVRVGGRSTNDAVAGYNIKIIRSEYEKEKKFPEIMQKLYHHASNEVSEMRLKLNKELVNITHLKENIVSEFFLKDVMKLDHYDHIKELGYNETLPERFAFNKSSGMIKWLGILDTVQSIHKHCNLCDSSDGNVHIKVKNAQEKHTPYEIPEFHDFKYKNASLDLGETSKGVYTKIDKKEIIKKTFRLQKWKQENVKPMSYIEAESVDNIADITGEEKWALYQYWVQKKCSSIYEVNASNLKCYEQACLRKKDVQRMKDIFILKNADIIGMTINGAALHKIALDEIKPVITIVEEAAHVFESNLISNLTSGCEQLIMIGDHKQLKPIPNEYRLEEKDMNVSLFERLINNGLRYRCLKTQHRMRPEIADNVRRFYENLHDHDSVKKYESVIGVVSNSFFVDHCIYEETETNSGDYVNRHEIDYILALCKYLLLQGYKASRITILTMYKSQLHLMKTEANKLNDGCQDVHMTSVDNFQGEENDIILLSLVRSNKNGNIGFVKDHNRVCVALSRSRIGLYIIGNSTCLSAKSELWKNVLLEMKQKRKLGKSLQLCCQYHLDDKGVMAMSAGDFKTRFWRGCNRPCTRRLDCGHFCSNSCHPNRRDHKCTKCSHQSYTINRNGPERQKKDRKGYSRKRPASDLDMERPKKKRLKSDYAGENRKYVQLSKVQKDCMESTVKLNNGSRNIVTTHEKNNDSEVLYIKTHTNNISIPDDTDKRYIKIKRESIVMTSKATRKHVRLNRSQNLERRRQGNVKLHRGKELFVSSGASSESKAIVYYGNHETFDNNSEEDQDNNGPAVKRMKNHFPIQNGDLRHLLRRNIYDRNQEQESDRTEGVVHKRPKDIAGNDLRHKLDKKIK
ncbi:NFX1-type zinc finger-containing protein 1-like [Ruditapes philippinarum]|uniref:NFX1-type zinc finger-containing protein 1-like n=1 Tax=Ruditapes philippinarum TaxID=129788 RepID=UPI00295ABFA8|nr:NFX1-type zinc finger-containing protein 1-like [Ruditapes philippinarum]